MRFKWILFFPLLAHATPGFHKPWGKDVELHYEETVQKSTPQTSSLAVRAAKEVILFHQNIISPIDGPRSHFRPTSSRYMLYAMQKHGFIDGFLMGCDRLMRENNDEWVYRKIEINGKLYKYDPVR